MHSQIKNKVVFAVITALLVIGFLEAAIRLLTIVSPRVNWLLSSSSTSDAIADRRLGHRPHPGHPEHDRNGFRNPGVPDQVHILALGDSQTYGTGVKPEEAWPRQLERLAGKTTYSMAFGGYGPAHSLTLWDEAISLAPQIVIEAFYAGNDLFDSFDHVYNRGQLDELKSHERLWQERLLEKEAIDPVAERIEQLFQMGMKPSDEFRGDSSPWVSHSKLFILLQRAYQGYIQSADSTKLSRQEQWELAKAFAEWNPDFCEVFSNGQLKTIFTSEYRFAALDLSDLRIAEGLSISLRAIKLMHDHAKSRDIRFIVLMIPTKEAVFSPLWDDPSEGFRNLERSEEHVWRMTKSFLEQNNIEYLDALPALQQQLLTGEQPYPLSHDGHPNVYGHQAIANLVYNNLK